MQTTVLQLQQEQLQQEKLQQTPTTTTTTMNRNNNKKIFVVGSRGLCDELQMITGCTIIHANELPVSISTLTKGMTREDIAHYPLDSDDTNNDNDDANNTDDNIVAFVIGHDPAFTFYKLAIVTMLLQKYSTAVLIATNLDAYDIVSSSRSSSSSSDNSNNKKKDCVPNRHIPGNGAMVRAVRVAAVIIIFFFLLSPCLSTIFSLY